MSVVAYFTVPAEQFVLGEILEVGDGPSVRLESLIPTTESVVPYFWVSSEDAEAVESALAESDLVETVAVIDETDSEVLFRVDWAEDIDGLFSLFGDTDAALLEAEGFGDDWGFRMRFAERTALSAFYQRCIERGITLDLEEVNSPMEHTGRPNPDLSEPQREMLVTALDEGYFDVPRQINLRELSEQLEISDTAASQRIRRGMKSLLTSTLGQRERSETDE